jgi:hypothetical protein
MQLYNSKECYQVQILKISNHERKKNWTKLSHNNLIRMPKHHTYLNQVSRPP